jgi:hypothetical protein
MSWVTAPLSNSTAAGTAIHSWFPLSAIKVFFFFAQSQKRGFILLTPRPPVCLSSPLLPLAKRRRRKKKRVQHNLHVKGQKWLLLLMGERERKRGGLMHTAEWKERRKEISFLCRWNAAFPKFDLAHNTAKNSEKEGVRFLVRPYSRKCSDLEYMWLDKKQEREKERKRERERMDECEKNTYLRRRA